MSGAARFRGLAAAAILLAAGTAAAQDPCGGLRLRDVASEAGLAFVHDRGGRGERHLPETMGSGAAWLDADADGRLDLYVVQSGPFPPDGSATAANRLFRNRGDGTFEDVTAGSGADDRGYGQGVLSADLDGNGHPDLYVCNFGPDVLLLNRGDGTFEDRTAGSGLGLDGWSSSAAAADYDGDGDLDLYVTRYVEYDPADAVFCGDVETGLRRYCDPTLFPGATDRLYRNEGGGRFTDVTAEAGIGDADGKGLGVVFTDLDGDRRPDLYVANDITINLLFRNRGDGTFEAASLLSGAGLNADGKAEAGMGVEAGDVDGDGDPDLLVSNFDVETNTLYRNLGGMRFEDVSAPSGFGAPSFNLLGFGTALADLDRDGDLDLYVTNGHIFERPKREGIGYAQPDLLMLGDGAGGFRPAGCGLEALEPRVGRGLAAGDYDDDGDLDLVVINSGGPLQLLQSSGVRGEWIGLRLRGEGANLEAVGAEVTLIGGSGRQRRWVQAGGSYQSTHDRRLLFGLRAGDTVERIEIAWPSGVTTALKRPATGAYLDVSREGTLGAAAAGPAERAPGSPRVPVPLVASLAVVLLGTALAWWWLRGRR